VLPRDSGSDRQAAIVFLVLLSICTALPAALLPAEPLWLLAAIPIAALIMLEPTAGLYAAIAVVGIDVSGPNTQALSVIFAGIPGLKATPVELLILWTTFSAFLRTLGQERQGSDGLVLTALVTFLVLLLLGVLNGVSKGGNFTIALWEVRAMLCILPVMLATNWLIRDRGQLKRLAIISVVVLVLMTVEAFWRYMTYVRPGTFSGVLEFAFGHETSVLVGLLMILCAAWSLWGPNRKQRLIALALALAAGVVEMTMRRRAGLIGAEVGLLTLGILLLIKDYRRFLIIAPIFLIVASAYLSFFWNSTKSVGEPARAFRTVFDSGSTAPRDQASDEYRRAEKLSVWANIHAKPIDGIGFGVVYAKPYPFWNLSGFWPFWEYIPHNTILWLWMKGGVVTFLAFWFLLGAAIVRMVAICRSTTDHFLVATSAGIAAFFPMLVLFSYVDLGLTNVRLMILVGVCFGLIGLLQRLALDHPEASLSKAGVM